MNLVRRPAFLRDLDLYAYQIAKDNPDAGRRFLEVVEATCRQLVYHPEIGHQESFRKLVGIRSWRVNGFERYLIFYRIEKASVDVLRLLHGAQNLPKFFTSRER